MPDWILTAASFVFAAIAIGLGIRQRRRSGRPWISKNPDDYY
jgi:hypothetical protein